MKVFLSWSGEQSRACAEALRAWLPHVMHSLKPWMSEEDIQAGANWQVELEKELAESQFGIICCTAENKLSPWVCYEAGKLIQSFGSRVVPLLFGLEKTQLDGPLAQRQAVKFSRDGMLKVLKSVNETVDAAVRVKDDQLVHAFDKNWDDLDLELLPHLGPRGERAAKIRIRSYGDLVEARRLLIDDLRYRCDSASQRGADDVASQAQTEIARLGGFQLEGN